MLAFDIRMDQQQFFYSLRSGKYLILFDGLDEVKDRYRRDSAARNRTDLYEIFK